MNTNNNAEIRDTLMKFMFYMERRGFFDPEAQFDFDHQVDTFLEFLNTDSKFIG